MKKRLIIEIVCGVLIFIVGYFIGDSSAIKRVNQQIDTKVENKQNKEAAVDKEKSETNKAKDKVYKIGEEGKVGNWNIKILEVKETNVVQGGNSSSNKTTKDKFVVIKLQMENISKQPVQYSAKEFMLGNMKDKTQYTVNDVAFSAMGAANNNESIYKRNSDFVGVYTDVNPNTSKQTYIVFEVPKDMNISDGVLINANGGAEATGFYLK